MVWTFQYKNAWDALPEAAEKVSEGLEKKNKRQRVAQLIQQLPKSYEDLKPVLGILDEPKDVATTFAEIYKQKLINSKRSPLDPLTRLGYEQILKDPNSDPDLVANIKRILVQADLEERGMKWEATHPSVTTEKQSSNDLMTPIQPEFPMPTVPSLKLNFGTGGKTKGQIEQERKLEVINALGGQKIDLENLQTENEINKILPAETKSKIEIGTKVKGAPLGPKYSDLQWESGHSRFMKSLDQIQNAVLNARQRRLRSYSSAGGI